MDPGGVLATLHWCQRIKEPNKTPKRMKKLGKSFEVNGHLYFCNRLELVVRKQNHSKLIQEYSNIKPKLVLPSPVFFLQLCNFISFSIKLCAYSQIV
ncbi:CLUMA_CG001592, isoform A [Clunio marinus]|uniref:CLUMA_CG001592, isoform A n=1 Tax=Clunio marinus TaxID=568069 RepID=A0A1J1HID1_9DIPT|nr:CLUMA_CG001592, isoform A [Clunio marinus]